MSEVLCRACGLCCDGSLFGRVPLAEDERVHLPLAPGGNAFDQPCPAHVDDACTIYETRPRACREFTCRLLARGGPVEPRLATILRVRHLLEHVNDNVDELRRRMDEDFARAT